MTHLNRETGEHITYDIHSFFIHKCYSLVLAQCAVNNTIETVIDRLIEDIKLPNDKIYRWLAECADETNEHMSYVIFDMKRHYYSIGGNPAKDINIFVNEYITLILTDIRDCERDWED